tara:strand:- start:629 stop:1630 length:1002 start_codon:yes stop_codon:yes gene_type:complete
MLSLNNKTILITGGTGSFGQEFCKIILKKYKKIKKLIIFSRDELKQFNMSLQKEFLTNPKVRFFLGDVRDKDRLARAFNDVDIIIHAAALKQVPAAEYNPTEFIKTNVIGAQNIIEVAIDKKIKQVIALSTDKAVSPVNLYGATKLCSDKLFIAANDYGLGLNKFSVVRYGNVISSRGSVIPKFKDINKKNISHKFPITDEDMTRFLISLKNGVETVLFALTHQIGGEIFVPKMPSCRVIDICEAINKQRKIEIVGIRPGEKLHEEIIPQTDSLDTINLKNFYIIIANNLNKKRIKNHFKKKFDISNVDKNFSYNSNENKFLDIKQIKSILED